MQVIDKHLNMFVTRQQEAICCLFCSEVLWPGSKRVDLRCIVGQWESVSWKMLPVYGPDVTRSSSWPWNIDNVFPEPSVVGVYWKVPTDSKNLTFPSAPCSWLHRLFGTSHVDWNTKLGPVNSFQTQIPTTTTCFSAHIYDFIKALHTRYSIFKKPLFGEM